ncbi:FKBP-type peptidyl-prolyl cis-trans isomerase [Candidatus Woesearchaeota archaeon]|nr:FKBP-type peptidyl-prolyl cis-trans isomerase [Candidatus Woesearchaeota archaeon]
MEENDDDIEIDFGKIRDRLKKVFKENPEKKKHKKDDAEEKEADDEITIDFSGIKKFFKSKPEKKKGKRESPREEEISIDFKSSFREVRGFFSRHTVLVLLIIAVFMAVYFRAMPAQIKVTDEWAKNSVHNYFRNQISTEINGQYPNLPQANKNNLIEAEFQKFLTQNKDQVNEQIKQASEYYKTQLRDENGNNYLSAIDAYFWARHARNIVNNGHPGDMLVDGKPYDNHMMAPLGRFVPSDMFHAYLEAYFYKFIRFFNPDATIPGVVFYMPVLLSALAVIPAFFIARRVGGNMGGFFAAMMVAIHPAFLTRTIGGAADSDAHNVLFPLLITWIFLEAFEIKDLKRKSVFAAVAGLLVGLYSFAWNSWWYIFDFLIGAAAVYLLFHTVTHFGKIKKDFRKFLSSPEIKHTLLLVLVFIVCSVASVSMMNSFNTFKGAMLEGPFNFIKLKAVAQTTIWPNVFTTVAEQNPLSFSQAIDEIGGKFLFFIAMIGAFLTLVKKDIHGKIDVKYAALLIIWIASTTYASVKGTRYTLLLVPAFSIAFGISIGVVFSYLLKWVTKGLKIEKSLSIVVLFLLFCLLFFIPVKGAGSSSIWKQANDIAIHANLNDMSDGWYVALDKINKEADKNAIVNSWWDFGHWFKYIADRPVTFDGTSQNSPQAHWIGKVLVTDNEEQAVGILRMLDCGATNAFDEVDREKNDTLASVNILYDLFEKDKEDARAVLKEEGFNDEQADKILSYTHCEPPEDYFIASEDMIAKSGVWAHFGSWNFTKAKMYYLTRGLGREKAIELLQKEFELNSDDAVEIYYEATTADPNQWIARWPGYASGFVGCAKKDENTLECGNGIIIDMKSPSKYEAYIESAQTMIHPKIFAYPVEDKIVVTEYSEPLIKSSTGELIGVTLVPSGKEYGVVLSSPELTNSIFTRLFFLQGQGLRHFKLFTHQNSLTGGDVWVWKVDWQGSEPNMMDELKPKITVKSGDEAEVNYIGWYDVNGSVFDSSIVNWEEKGVTKNSEFSSHSEFVTQKFIIGEGRMIAGFEEGILGMNISDEKTIIIPPEKGYPAGTNHPLANQTLGFKIRVESIS